MRRMPERYLWPVASDRSRQYGASERSENANGAAAEERMDLTELIRRTEQIADLEQAKPVGEATQYRSEAHYPVPCFLELNCKNNVYLIYFGLYYDVFRFRFHEGKVLFKGELREAKQYIEAHLVNDIQPLRKIAPAEFLARATPMPFGDMGICDENFINSIRTYDGASTLAIIGKMDALGTSDKPVALEVLKPFLKHPRASIRMHALTAILSLRINENDKLKAIIETLEDCDPMIRELSSYCSKLMFKTSPYKG
jgi:hypothetical protein